MQSHAFWCLPWEELTAPPGHCLQHLTIVPLLQTSVHPMSDNEDEVRGDDAVNGEAEQEPVSPLAEEANGKVQS